MCLDRDPLKLGTVSTKGSNKLDSKDLSKGILLLLGT